jgi:hypothetical protein
VSDACAIAPTGAATRTAAINLPRAEREVITQSTHGVETKMGRRFPGGIPSREQRLVGMSAETDSSPKACAALEYTFSAAGAAGGPSPLRWRRIRARCRQQPLAGEAAAWTHQSLRTPYNEYKNARSA